jgi:hypothetical protein
MGLTGYVGALSAHADPARQSGALVQKCLRSTSLDLACFEQHDALAPESHG